ncbi:putative C6 transcription factor [Thelonectria olida]|uniref:C6 transcription factor n=1 Tax=Thelonectria olida TaxID=1576542 RepID=A0A9P8VXA3_9HYPO|nr:putative C6 transcription factor [Thelonectria olida]
MASYLADQNPFANLFLLADNAAQAPTLHTAGISDQPRKKRAHRKSRQGCIACKRRRVKCDEQVPCSNCTRRNEKCTRPPQAGRESIPSSLSSPKFEASKEPELNLLHLELFSHFEKQTVPTLTFSEFWPGLMQQAFHEEFVMSTMLCVSAAHLAFLNPQDVRYARASAQLLPKSLRLLRQSLSHPFTKRNAHALLGTSFLMSYISWCDLKFLAHESPAKQNLPYLDLSQDHLLLLSPGVLQVYFQALPFLIADGNAYTSMSHRRPRLRLERVLNLHGEDPARFLKPFMDIWDDPRYQTRPTQALKASSNSTPPQSWLLYLKIKPALRHIEAPGLSSQDEVPSPTPVELANAISELNSPLGSSDMDASARANNMADLGGGYNDSKDESQLAYEQMARRVSPILCCVSLLADKTSEWSQPAAQDLKADFAQMFFSFPILYCWPFLKLTANGDSRALVILFHFYHGARILLDSANSWWACERSRVMEKLILDELKSRGLEACPWG